MASKFRVRANMPTVRLSFRKPRSLIFFAESWPGAGVDVYFFLTEGAQSG